MATLAVTNPTLLDLAKRLEPNGGRISSIVEILNQTNEILMDMTFQEGNLLTGERTTVRTGIPAPTWRKLNQGVQPNKSQTAQVDFGTGMLEAWSEVDKDLADLNGLTSEFLLSEAKPHIEGMNIEMADTLFHGNETTEPEAFTGLGAFYNDSTAANGENIIKAGGAGSDNSSIWLVVWSPETIYGIVPKGSTAGLKMTNFGEQVKENALAADGSSTGLMRVYRTHFKWDAGLVVRDWRFAVRIANIDKSLLTFDAASGADLINLMIQAEEKIPNINSGRAVWYMPRNIRTYLRTQRTAAAANQVTEETVAGKLVVSFDGIPVRRVDQLAGDEAVVV